jgi:hypothetical protein
MLGMRIRCLRLLATTTLSIGFCVLAADAPADSPTIYKWVDENGIAHYTTDRERIPRVIRDRVESVAAKPTSTAPGVAAQPNREDLMRDAVRSTSTPGAAVTPVAMSAPSAPAPNVEAIAAPSAAPTPTPAAMPSDREANAEADTDAEPAAATEDETREIAAPAPIESDLRDESPAVSAPPPAAPVELAPDQQVAVTELDQQIEVVKAEIAQREETLAALISTSDEQRTTPLVDDPAFREISQRLPKLQADLQTLRERRNKIQPTAPTP